MGPGLVPGDFVATGWLPDRDRWRSPRRFDRWIVRLPDGSTGLKRIAGLPGETVGIVNGDLEIDGALTVKNPWQSATLGSVVSREQPEDTSRWSRPSKVVLDRAPVAATMVNLRLLPVCDVGFAATIRLTEPAAGGCRARAVAGPLAVTWRLSTAGRLAIVAGRLDGQAVAAAWPLPAAGDRLARWPPLPARQTARPLGSPPPLADEPCLGGSRRPGAFAHPRRGARCHRRDRGGGRLAGRSLPARRRRSRSLAARRWRVSAAGRLPAGQPRLAAVRPAAPHGPPAPHRAPLRIGQLARGWP